MIKSIIYLFLFVLVLITPFVSSNELYDGIISAKQIWFYGAMSLVICGFATDVMISRKKIGLRINIIDVSLLTFYLYFFIRVCFTPYTPILHNQKLLNYSLLVLFYLVVKYTCADSSSNKDESITGSLRDKSAFITIISLVLMLTGLTEAILGLMQLYGLTKSYNPAFKITGTFINPAPYALYLAAIFPISLATIFTELKNERIKEYKFRDWINLLIHGSGTSYHFFIQLIAWITVISILIVLPATMNRASWVGIGVSSLFVLNKEYSLIKQVKEWLINGVRKMIAMTVLLTMIVLFVTGLYHLKVGSSFGHLFIWEVTSGKIIEKSLFGYGVGRFEAEYNNWQADYFQNHHEAMDGPKGRTAGNTKYCFNEYLEMGSEIGLIGLFLFLAMITTVFWRTGDNNGFKELKNKVIHESYIVVDEIKSDTSFIFIPSFVSLIVCALISFPFYSLSTLIVFFLLLAIISSSLKDTSILNGIKVLTKGRYFNLKLIIFILLPVSILLFYQTIQQYKAYYNWKRSATYYRIGNYKDAVNLFSQYLEPFQFNGTYLQFYGKALNSDKRYAQSIEILERASHHTSDEILYTSLGDSYGSVKRYPEAEQAYLYALFMSPGKLYPEYLLANLYAETGQKEKAIRTAKHVLGKTLKIESTTTEEIKSKMEELILKLTKQETE